MNLLPASTAWKSRMNQIGGESGFHYVAVGTGSKCFSRIIRVAVDGEKNNLG